MCKLRKNLTITTTNTKTIVSIYDIKQPRTTPTPYPGHGMCIVYSYRATAMQPANNQPYKEGKMLSLGSRPESIIAFQDLLFTSVATW